MFKVVICISALFVLFVLCGAASDETVVHAETSNQQNMVYSRGVLLKNKKLTSCEIVPIADVGAFIAANCLAGDPDNTKYSILWQNTQSETSNKVYSMDIDQKQITVHSRYKEPALAYNIAVIDFNNGFKYADSVWTDIDGSTLTAGALSFDKLVLNKNLTMWEPGIKIDSSISGQKLCGTISSLVNYNFNKYVCTDNRLNYTQNKKQVPYAVATIKSSASSKNVNFYALYSHSLINSNSMQNATAAFSYYSVLSYYLQFAQNALNVKLSATQNGQHVSADTLRPDDMNVVDETANGFSPVGGDFFIERLSSAQPTLTRPSSPTPTEANSSESDTDPQATSDSENSDKPVKSAGDKSKLSTGAVVGIAVSMSIVGAALLAVGIICARKCYHKRSAELYWNREVSRLQSSKDLSTPRA